MDPWASLRGSYTQGALLLRNPKLILNEWLAHDEQLGEAYPVRAIRAGGTHGDISPNSGAQARDFADTIIKYNSGPGAHPKLVNATLPQFCRVVDELQARKPFLRVVRGCFGHSWDLWPVSTAKYAADVREGERTFLAAEALLAIASGVEPELQEVTRAERERAEWCWAMLADHAWNGTDVVNKRHNADLRWQWSEELVRLSQRLQNQGWTALGLRESERKVALFNSLSVPRAELVRLDAPAGVNAVAAGSVNLPSQLVEEDGRRVLYFVSPKVPGFSFKTVQIKKTPPPAYPRLRSCE